MKSAMQRLGILRYAPLLGLVAVVMAFFPEHALAGFGITPPYVNNERLTRGTQYKQEITLVRSDPNEDLKAVITLNIPGAESWISIDKGKEFTLPKGERQVPIVITVTVPKDAEYKQYKGAIRIRTSAADNAPAGGGVSIALGAQIDVDMKVVDKIYDFEVRRIRLVDLEEGHTRFGLFFPAKIRFFMTIENTGNTEYGPTKVKFDIFDSEQETLLESTENTNRIERIAPFGIKEIVAELPTRLPAGRYAAKYTIFNGEKVAQQNVANISIAVFGAVPGYEGYGFEGLSVSDKLKVLVILGVPFALLVGLIIAVIIRRKNRRRPRPTHAFR